MGSDREFNPYTAQLYDAIKRKGLACVEPFTRRGLLLERYDVFHIHWPDVPLRAPSAARAAWRALVLLAICKIAKLRGARICWTVHNLEPHEEQHPLVSRRYWTAFTRLVDGAISLSEAAVPAIEARTGIPGTRMYVVPHGHYREAYPVAEDRGRARDALGVPRSARVLLFVGQVRPYKGVPALLRAFSQIEDTSLRLIVAGRSSEAHLSEVIRSFAATDDRVMLRLEHVPSAELPRLLATADLVVLPYRAVLNSGAALLALSFNRPVLVPATGTFAELAGYAGSGWVRTFEGELTRGQIERALAAGSGPDREPDLSRFDWDRIAVETVGAYRALASAYHQQTGG